VRDDIERRGVTTAYLVGGTVALSDNVEDQLRRAGVDSVTRFAGATRYDTAAMVADAMDHQPSTAFVASGDDHHLIDALAAGGIGARNQWPVLLTKRDSLPAVTRDALEDLGVSRSFAVGGPIPISREVVDQLPGGQRVAGDTLYETAEALADTFVSVGTDRVVIASGDRDNIIDALGGGTFGHIILLTQRDQLTPVTERWLVDRGVGKAVVVGGPLAVSDKTVKDILRTLEP
jgi:putative cell wall-binding protein